MARTLLNKPPAQAGIIQYKRVELSGVVGLNPGTGAWYDITGSWNNISFTPKSASSQLLLTLCIEGDHGDTWREGMFRVYETTAGELFRGALHAFVSGHHTSGNVMAGERVWAPGSTATRSFTVQSNTHPQGNVNYINAFNQGVDNGGGYGGPGGAFFSITEFNSNIVT